MEQDRRNIRERKLFIVIMFFALILSQDITWAGIKTLIVKVLDVSAERYSTIFFMAEGYCGFAYLFMTTAVIRDSRNAALKILERPISIKLLRIFAAAWYGIQYCFEKISEGQDSEAADNLKKHLTEIRTTPPGVLLILAFGFVFVVTLLLYFFSTDAVRSIITGLFSLASAMASFALFVQGFEDQGIDGKR